MNLGVTYIPAFLPNHIETDMKELNLIGCNEVLFALSENSIFVQKGSWKYGVNIAKENGLEPMAVIWGYANTFGGGRISKVMLDDIEMWVRNNKSELIPHACYNNPKIREHFFELTDTLYNAGYTSIFIDEPSLQPCWCKYCRDKFEKQYGYKLPDQEGDKNYQEFMYKNTIDYVSAICKGIKQHFPLMRTMACLMPQDEVCWNEVTQIAELDNFGTDPYWLLDMAHITLEQSVDLSYKCRELALSRGKQSHIWLNGWFIPAGKEKDIYTGGLQLAKAGHDGFYTWSFHGALGTNEESDNPDCVWDYVCKLYKELSGK